MQKLATSFSKEPAVWIGFIFSIILLAAQQALAAGIVTSERGINLLNVVIGLVPLISGLLTRVFVSPAV